MERGQLTDFCRIVHFLSPLTSSPVQVIVTYADDDAVLVMDYSEPALIPPAVRPAGRRFTVGSTHMVRVQRRMEEDEYGL